MTELTGHVYLYEENQEPSSKENVGEVSLLRELLGDAYLARPFGPPEPSAPSSSSGSALRHDRVVITADHITQKRFPLTYIPANPSAIIFLPEGGIAQFFEEEFDVDENFITWDGLGLDGFIEENEVIHIYYT